jgi:hypothetical protein
MIKSSNKIMVGVICIIVLLVLIILGRLYSVFGEKFNDVNNSDDKSKNSSYITPTEMNEYKDLMIKKEKEQANINVCPSIERGICANMPTSAICEDDLSGLSSQKTEINNNIKKCKGETVFIDNLTNKTDNYVYKKSFDKIDTESNYIDSELKDYEKSKDRLINREYVTNFFKYKKTTEEMIQQENKDYVMSELQNNPNTFANVMVEQEILSEDSMKTLYPSKIEDFFGSYTIKPYQYNNLGNNITFLLKNNELKVFNNTDLIKVYSVTINQTKYLQFPTTTIELILKERDILYYISSLKIKENAGMNNIMIKHLENAKFGDGKFYLHGNDGKYILYNERKKTIFHLEKINNN